MKNILEKQGFICDMDGVIYHGDKILEGVREFVNWMLDNGKKFVFRICSANPLCSISGQAGAVLARWKCPILRKFTARWAMTLYL